MKRKPIFPQRKEEDIDMRDVFIADGDEWTRRNMEKYAYLFEKLKD